MEYIQRDIYLDKLKDSSNNHYIKVLTGVHNVGKSVIMEQFRDYLINSGVSKDQIVYINFEDFDHIRSLDTNKLVESILNKASVINKEHTYVFLIELQMVTDYESIITRLLEFKNLDIIIASSNASILSIKSNSLLSDRYIHIHVLPLSYLQTKTPQLDSYLKFGGFPVVLDLKSEYMINEFLAYGVLSSVILKHILRNRLGIDIVILEDILYYIYLNIGSEVSIKNIANTLTSNGYPASYNTVSKYLSFLMDSFLIYRVNNYDIRIKQHLKQNGKYYAVDPGLRNSLLQNKEPNTGYLLENTVFLELLARDYNISVKKTMAMKLILFAKNKMKKCIFRYVNQ
jgi:predicted AAA+ superfamily ATPase